MNIKELIDYGKSELKESNIEDYLIISKSLAKFILKMNDMELTINSENEVEKEKEEYYKLALAEIINGKPLQYITNTQEFYGLDFYVDENVLIPQPDTEILVEEVLNITGNQKNTLKILDMCTGSGCIGISIANKRPNDKVYLLDISSDALDVAKKNAKEILKDEKNIEYIQSDMFDEIEEEFDVIVSNPPYIAEHELEDLSEYVKNEPLLALYGGEDGLDYYKILVKEAFKYLSDDGYLCMEIGYSQKEKVIELLESNGNYKNIYSKKDLAGNDRIVIAQFNN